MDAIKALYTNTTPTIVTPDGVRLESFEVKAGVLQGDTLAPFSFIVVLDYVIGISLDNNKEHGLLVKSRQSSRCSTPNRP